MNTILIAAVISLVSLVFSVIAIGTRRTKIAIALIVLLGAQAIFTLSVGMSGLRPHIELAKEQGKNNDFIDGMVERDRFFFDRRVALGITMLSLCAISVVAVCAGKNNRAD